MIVVCTRRSLVTLSINDARTTALAAHAADAERGGLDQVLLIREGTRFGVSAATSRRRLFDSPSHTTRLIEEAVTSALKADLRSARL